MTDQMAKTIKTLAPLYKALELLAMVTPTAEEAMRANDQELVWKGKVVDLRAEVRTALNGLNAIRDRLTSK